MKWYRVFSSHVPQKKCEPFSASVAGTLLPSAVSAVGGFASNVMSLFGASSNRDWQEQENEKNRQWQEKMWNLQNEYNSPAHQRQLLQEAGYNPYMFGKDSPFVGAGSSGAPAMTGAPALPNLSNPLNGSAQILQQGLQLEANQEEQHSKAISNMVRVAIDAYKELGYKGYKDVMDVFSPVLANIDFQGSRADVVFNNQLQNWLSERYNMDMDSLNKELSYTLGSKYSEQQIQAGLEKIQYDISEIVGRLNTLNVQNQALLDRTAAEVVEKTAAAFNLRKSGEKFVADAKTVNAVRDAYTKIIEHEAAIKAVQAYFSSAEKESSDVLVGYMTSSEGRERKAKAYSIGLEQKSSDLIRAADKVLGEYFNVNFSYGNTHSYNPTYQSIHPSVYSTNYIHGQ